jgi:antitoxin component HigA of HigAB toxin-antitoxin module
MPDPIEAIKFRMEQMGYNQNDLANIVGKKSCERNLKSQAKTFIGNDPSIARAVKHSYRCFDTSVFD